MSKEILLDENTKLTLSEKATKTHDEIVTELQRLLILLGTTSPAIRSAIEPLAQMMAELVHWMHDPSGQHPTPSEMLMEHMQFQKAGASSDDRAPSVTAKKGGTDD